MASTAGRRERRLRRSATPAPDLLELTQQGDLEAFGRFYDETAPALATWLERRTAAGDVAADLCAETFAKAIQLLDRYRPIPDVDPAAWVFGIARNEFRDWLRHERVRSAARERLGMRSPSAHSDELDLVEMRVDLERHIGPLRDALGLLSPGLRAAIELRVIDELSYAEVAERLGCSNGAARVRVSRGLAQLLDTLDDTPGGGDPDA